MIAADGRALWLRDYVNVVVENDQVVGIRGVMVDVSERKRIEEALAVERERLAVTLQSMSDGIVVMDVHKRIVMTNPTGQAYLSWLTTARAGETLTSLGDRELEELLGPSPGSGPRHEVTVAGPPKLVFEVAAHPMQQGPEVGGWVLALRDVTAEQEIRQRIQTQERLAAVGQLAAGIAHDFNNILTVIIGLADLLHRDPQVPDRTRSSLGVIFEQGRRAAGLIRQILDFSRQSLSQKKSLDLVPLVKETTKFMRTVIPEDIQLELQMGPGEYVIHADPTQIQQVLTNLVVNARDAMSEQGGRLTVELSRRRFDAEDRRPFPDMPPSEWIVVKIADTGTGIAAEALPHIFEPFFTTKEVGQGTGLGLAQVYGIVKQHEGFIDLETEVGKGTSFILYLPPVRAEETQSVEDVPIEGPQGRGELILLVEDEEQVLQVAREVLETLGYRVLTAQNGREALRVYNERKDEVDLIITDMTMPEMGGLQLVQALQMRGSQVRVVVLSGYPFVEGWQTVWGDNVVAWVSKPLRVNEIAEVVKRALTGEAKA
jgi:signal transduction histidine kinase/ActR/RegA family two-component response regulator